MILYIMLLFFYCFWRTLGCFARHDATIIINKILCPGYITFITSFFFSRKRRWTVIHRTCFG